MIDLKNNINIIQSNKASLKAKLILTSFFFLLNDDSVVVSQVIPDNTLPNNSIVAPNGSIIEISGGTTTGSNLFHSFQDFSVLANRTALFNNGLAIKNILSRVTGNSISNIDGSIRANGNANLFLINPNGIIFGENASLDIGGSFYGSTADSILFSDGIKFSATNTEEALLTINMPIGLDLGNNPGEITNRSFVQNSTGEFVGLEVATGKNLVLVGGNINFEAGEATAKDGNIQLGGLSAAGTVGINEDGSLNFPQDVTRADIRLSNATDLDVRGTSGGKITINARNFNLEAGDFGSSSLRAGITADSTAANTQIGDITINATENVTVDSSFILNQVSPEAIGNAGSVIIATDSLSLINGGQISTSTFGRGNAGSVTVNARSVDLIEGGTIESITTASGNAGSINIQAQAIEITGNNPITNRSSGFFSSVGLFDAEIPGESGNGGNLTIETDSLRVTNGGRISADIFGTNPEATAGSINIKANSIEVIGFNSNNQSLSGIFAAVTPFSSGNAGNVVVETEALRLEDGGFISTSTFGEGDAGSLNVKAKSIEVIGLSTSNVPSRLRANVDFFGDSRSTGNGGDLIIETETLLVADGAEISTSTFANGNAGSINITATDTITFDGEDLNGFPSTAISTVEQGAVGDAGGINISTNSLVVTNGAEIDASTFGEGNAGAITINATDTITLDGEGITDSSSSGIDSIVSPGTRGNAGGINITTGSLDITNGAVINASTFGEGNAGAININATDTINFSGEKSDGAVSGAFSTVTTLNSDFPARGNAGGINISTKSLLASDGAQISASTFGEGNANSITIIATDTINFHGRSTSGSPSGSSGDVALGAIGNAGGVNITTGSLTVTDGGEIGANTRGQGNAGLVIINAFESVTVDGGNFPSAIAGSVLLEGSGDAEGISITTNSLTLTNGGVVSSNTSGEGNAGDINVNAKESVIISGQNDIVRSGLSANALVSNGNGADINVLTDQLTINDSGTIEAGNFDNSGNFEPGTGTPGNINLEANTISLSNQGTIEAATQSATGNSANITLKVTEDLTLDNNSLISVRAFEEANGGNLNLEARQLTVSDGGTITAQTSGTGNAGNIFLEISDEINLTGDGSGLVASTGKDSTGKGGSISTQNQTPQTITIQDGASIAVNSDGTGEGGSVTLGAENLTIDKGAITAETDSSQGGNITLAVGDSLRLENSGKITASAGNEQNPGDGGNVTINADTIFAFPTNNPYEITAKAFTGDGGNIDIKTNNFFGYFDNDNDFVNIDASSNQGVDGDVEIDILEVDPARGITDLPSNIVDASRLIDKSCLAGGAEESANEFVVTGRGGLPENPSEVLKGNAVLSAEWVTLPQGETGVNRNQKTVNATNTNKIVEAQGWVVGANGNVVLTAQATKIASLAIPWLAPHNCD